MVDKEQLMKKQKTKSLLVDPFTMIQAMAEQAKEQLIDSIDLRP